MFIAPPSMQSLRDRLEGRGTDSPEVIERRLKKSADEMNEAHRYDRVIVNDNLDKAFAELVEAAGLEGERFA